MLLRNHLRLFPVMQIRICLTSPRVHQNVRGALSNSDDSWLENVISPDADLDGEHRYCIPAQRAKLLICFGDRNRIYGEFSAPHCAWQTEQMLHLKIKMRALILNLCSRK